MDNDHDFQSQCGTHSDSIPLAPQLPDEAVSRHWYAVQTRPHNERVAAFHLRQQRFDVYLPVYLKRRRHARRVDTVTSPLFPRYLFVNVGESQRWNSICSTRGVTRLVSSGDAPAEVPQSVIKELRQREDASGHICLEHPPRFRAGDRVRVSEGVFGDCSGIFDATTGPDRVAILLDLLGRKVRVTLEASIVDAA